MQSINKDNYYGIIIPVAFVQQNCLIYANKETKEAIVVDPGSHGAVIAETVAKEGLTVKAVLVTHAHFDHIGGIEDFRDALGYSVPVLGPFKEDEVFFDNVIERAQEWNLPADELAALKNYAPRPENGDRFLDNNEEINVIGLTLKAVHTPGHSPGHAIFVDHGSRQVICGDLVFFHSVGRTDLAYSNFSDLEKSVRESIFTLPEDYKLLPGHGPATTVGEEKANNPYVTVA